MAKRKKKRSRPLGDPPGRVCFPQELVVGIPNPRVEGSHHNSVCLSPKQFKKLFGKELPGRPIGAGTFAVVWAKNKDEVVKITSDPTDAMALIAAQGPSVVKVKKAYRLAQAGRRVGTVLPPKADDYREPTPIVGMITERLIPIPDGDRRAFYAGVNREWLMSEGAQYAGPRKDFELSDEYDNVVRYDCREAYGSDREEPARKLCMSYGQSVGAIFARLMRRGVYWTDIHHGNVGFDPKTHELKVLDLGMTTTAAKDTIPVINGAKGLAGWQKKMKERYRAIKRRSRR